MNQVDDNGCRPAEVQSDLVFTGESDMELPFGGNYRYQGIGR
ncbi:unnamed protein product [marine sediment metagenome]|uniref:Uncharacterized protein n=1 Tax=marine sediment metagenome TaxID=412755 RepID=X1US97_9ZZZZ